MKVHDSSHTMYYAETARFMCEVDSLFTESTIISNDYGIVHVVAKQLPFHEKDL